MNVRVQWARNGITGHQDDSFNQQPSSSTKVAFDYVATRDIAKGEELFLDYGDDWEEEWHEAFKVWDGYEKSKFEDYVSATEFNRLHGEEPLLTTEEQHSDPYPDNLSTRCHWLLAESKKSYTGNVSALSRWAEWSGDSSGLQCHVLSRNPENKSYTVKVVLKDGTRKRLTSVPRQAIRFADNPYSKLCGHSPKYQILKTTKLTVSCRHTPFDSRPFRCKQQPIYI